MAADASAAGASARCAKAGGGCVSKADDVADSGAMEVIVELLELVVAELAVALGVDFVFGRVIPCKLFHGSLVTGLSVKFADMGLWVK